MTTRDTTGFLPTMLLLFGCLLTATTARSQAGMENLGRGLVALRTGETSVYVGWRLLGTDPPAVGFNLYRAAGTNAPIRVNKTLLMKTTDFVDAAIDPGVTNTYTVRPVPGRFTAGGSLQRHGEERLDRSVGRHHERRARNPVPGP